MSSGGLKLMFVFIAAAGILLAVFQLAEQRSEQVLLPRYCDAPGAHLKRVRKILTEARPAEEEYGEQRLIDVLTARARSPLDELAREHPIGLELTFEDRTPFS